MSPAGTTIPTTATIASNSSNPLSRFAQCLCTSLSQSAVTRRATLPYRTGLPKQIRGNLYYVAPDFELDSAFSSLFLAMLSALMLASHIRKMGTASKHPRISRIGAITATLRYRYNPATATITEVDAAWRSLPLNLVEQEKHG